MVTYLLSAYRLARSPVLGFVAREFQMQLVTVDDVLEMMGDTSNLAEKGELEKLIEAVGRVFSTNDGSDYIPYPTGYSGEVNKVRRRTHANKQAREFGDSFRAFATAVVSMAFLYTIFLPPVPRQAS